MTRYQPDLGRRSCDAHTRAVNSHSPREHAVKRDGDRFTNETGAMRSEVSGARKASRHAAFCLSLPGRDVPRTLPAHSSEMMRRDALSYCAASAAFPCTGAVFLADEPFCEASRLPAGCTAGKKLRRRHSGAAADWARVDRSGQITLGHLFAITNTAAVEGDGGAR